MASTTAQLKIIGLSKDIENNDPSAANGNVVVIINEHFMKDTAGI
jgi:hypothetical protein